jgi:5'-nucleotidase
MHFLWDMDGPLAQFEKRMFDILRGLIPLDEVIDPRARRTFRLRDQYPAKHHELILSIMCSQGFYLEMEPMPDSISAMREQLEEGHEVSIVTTPLIESAYCVQEKFEWVRMYLDDAWLKRLIITYDKTHIKGDVLIDDKPEIDGRGDREWQQVVFDLPHNHSFNTLPRLCHPLEWRQLLST